MPEPIFVQSWETTRKRSPLRSYPIDLHNQIYSAIVKIKHEKRKQSTKEVKYKKIYRGSPRRLLILCSNSFFYWVFFDNKKLRNDTRWNSRVATDCISMRDKISVSRTICLSTIGIFTFQNAHLLIDS